MLWIWPPVLAEPDRLLHVEWKASAGCCSGARVNMPLITSCRDAKYLPWCGLRGRTAGARHPRGRPGRCGSHRVRRPRRRRGGGTEAPGGAGRRGGRDGHDMTAEFLLHGEIGAHHMNPAHVIFMHVLVVIGAASKALLGHVSGLVPPSSSTRCLLKSLRGAPGDER